MKIEDLVGGRITAMDDNGLTVLHDGVLYFIRLDETPDEFLDCCGYNEWDIVHEPIDFEDNFITAIDVVEDESDLADCLELRVFTNIKVFEARGEAGSASGWNYGQSVSIRLSKLDANNVEEVIDER